MAKNDVVFSAETAPYRYLDLLPVGSRMTVMTKSSTGSRTNKVALLRKQDDPFGDWEVLSRPTTADAALLPETWADHPGFISTRTLADTFVADPELWATVDE